jgi:hypothetical protein
LFIGCGFCKNDIVDDTIATTRTATPPIKLSRAHFAYLTLRSLPSHYTAISSSIFSSPLPHLIPPCPDILFSYLNLTLYHSPSGRHHIISVMFALLDDHPDAIMMWKDTKYLPNECILKSKHYFSGNKHTRICTHCDVMHRMILRLHFTVDTDTRTTSHRHLTTLLLGVTVYWYIL